MKKFLSDVFAKKRNLIILAVIFFGIICPVIYTLTEIMHNAQQASVYITTPYYPTYPTPNTQGKSAADIALIQRGAYLVKAGDCIACHSNTAEKGAAFAGGLPMQTAFGTIYSPNITPDKETGIGNWTDAQFIKAMHEGISPTGEYYYPAFPYIYFNMINEDDLKAIKAYLGSLPPVHQVNRENTMIFPFNWRFLQLGWRLLFFNPEQGPYQPNPKQSAQWNRGAYLVEGLGHCAMCHTPSYYIVSEQLSLGAPIKKYNLTGAVVQGYLAPNITKTNLGGIPDNQLTEIFTKAMLIGGGQLQGPMLEAVHDSLSHLTTADMVAIATYLKSVESEMPPQPNIGEGAAGAYIYNSYCSGCHDPGIGNTPRLGDAARWNPLIKSGINKLYAVAIKGVDGMPAKGTCIHCSDRDIKNAVDYMVAAVKTPAATPATPTPLPAPVSSNRGQQIYQDNCSSCHSSGNKKVPQLGDQQAWKSIVDGGFLRAYRNIVSGNNGHPVQGGCKGCSGEDLQAAVKYMLQKGAPNRNYLLW